MSDTWGLTASIYQKCWSEDENQVLSPKIVKKSKCTPKNFLISKSSHAKLKIWFFRLACEDFQIDKKMVLFDFFYGGNPKIGPILGVSSFTHLHCKSTKFLKFCIFLYSFVNLFIVWPIPNTKNTFLALKVVIWKLGQMGLEHILYLKVCRIHPSFFISKYS